MGLCYTLKLLATVLKWDLRGYWAKASWCQVSWRYATVRNLQVSYVHVHAGHLGVILPPSASQPLIAMKESHTSSDQQADTSFPSYLSDRFIILKFFTYAAKEGRGKNRGNYNSGHRLHAKDFFGRIHFKWQFSKLFPKCCHAFYLMHVVRCFDTPWLYCIPPLPFSQEPVPSCVFS